MPRVSRRWSWIKEKRKRLGRHEKHKTSSAVKCTFFTEMNDLCLECLGVGAGQKKNANALGDLKIVPSCMAMDKDLLHTQVFILVHPY
ncbi:hypothetical protein SAMN04487936_11335 [Halobacillus dabanensis]|uniref:Uncharacterized protein n=1 Tax=Halobacillus dabanensis TaxID=240302 RepID=A0A1I3Z8V8_HALDA|nr:hypothetical protein SAMN04487936_11335 [Halobacillus dabanensis]